MADQTVFNRVAKILTEQLDVELSEVSMTSSMADDLNADSLDLVEVVLALEEEFGIEINDEEAEKMTTVEQIVNYISDNL